MCIVHRLIKLDIWVIWKSQQGFKRYRADTKYSHTMVNLELWHWPWTDFGQICAVLFVNLTRGSKDIKWTRKPDGQTNRQTDWRTDNGAKTICLAILFRGDNNYLQATAITVHPTNDQNKCKARYLKNW